ncbi:hypothetical protein IGB42_02070 [Andreprevotia sp. IGB-42]|uniref:hypothetical protein n=1 Tax=Andreprevotia sp. IGB-42 TaxID=2497473 RepID=UPI00135CCCE0|nr:hypothetical protein [Andreprevotia sp. IGB-42]KAF0813717.1 hypothetical protein IGB42_02070 [Andreprevotia sp. IGB-42]
MAELLTTASSLQCPHGGTVSIVSANVKTKAGAALALATDTFTIAGCPFQIPVGTGTVPSPCVSVRWVVTNMRTKVDGTPTLSKTSSGVCLAATQAPQGPVSIVQTQPKASGQ